MDQAKTVRAGEELDFKKLEDYLRDKIPELNGEMKVQQFHGGHANLTYLISFGEQELVVRRPPFGKIAPGAHDMKREFRVLSKLYKYFPAAPQAFLLCEDEAIIGAKFVVMERRQGVLVRYALPDCFKSTKNAEERLTIGLVKVITDLHKVDYVKAALEKLGRPENFLERQIGGWAKRWELSKTSENKEMDDVLSFLQKEIPTSQTTSIVHNDLKFDNCQFQPDNPDLVTSVFDWDMCTLGDPLVDFGVTLAYWPDAYFKNMKMPVLLSGNFPNKSFLIDQYKTFTGFNLDNLPWYEAFAYWKNAVIAQQLYERYLKGSSTDPRMEKFGLAAKAFSSKAKSIFTN